MLHVITQHIGNFDYKNSHPQMYQSNLYFTFEFIILLELKVNVISSQEFHIIFFYSVLNEYQPTWPV